MSNHLVAILIRHGMTHLRNGGTPFFLALLMSTMGLYGLSVFGTFLVNVDRITGGIEKAAAAVVFLDVSGAGAAGEVKVNIESLEGVRAATLVPPDEVRRRAQAAVGETGEDLDLEMPWVIEVEHGADPAGAETLFTQIEALPGVDEIMHPTGELSRIESILSLFRFAGLFLLVLVATLVVVVVSNAVKITLYARRDEIAIMKLVGATDMFVRVPFLFEGAVQGMLGGTCAIVLLALTQGGLTSAINVALADTLGAVEIAPLPVLGWVMLPVMGALLGLIGSAVSIGRFLRV